MKTHGEGSGLYYSQSLREVLQGNIPPGKETLCKKGLPVSGRQPGLVHVSIGFSLQKPAEFAKEVLWQQGLFP